MAFVAIDGAPRLVPTWFHWTGHEFVMPTFICAPHVARPPRRLRDLRADPRVAVSVDAEGFLPVALTLRGEVTVTEAPGLAAEYVLAAYRYMGGEHATEYLASLDDPSTRMARIALRPSWVGLLDFQTRLPSALAVAR